MSRIRSTAALAVVALLTAAGCSTSANSSSGGADPATAPTSDAAQAASPDQAPSSAAALDPDQNVEIVFESYNLGQSGLWADTVNELMDQFNTTHPGITVTGQPPQGMTSAGFSTIGSIQSQILVGQAPDVGQITFDGLAYAIDEVGVEAISDLVGAQAVEEHFGGQYPFHPRAKVLADRDGKTYGIPYVFSTPILWLNATIFEQAGLDPDTVDLSTWDAVATAAEAIKASTGNPPIVVSCVAVGGNWCMQALFRSGGAEVLSQDRTTIEFASPEAIAVVEAFRDLYDRGLLANEPAQSDSFQRGDAAIHLQTSVMQAYFQGAAASGGWELRSTGMPGFDGHEVVPTNSGSALLIFSTDPIKQAAAWEFIKFMTSPQAAESISTKIGYLPMRPTTMTEADGPLHDWYLANPLVQPNLEQMDIMQPWVAYPGKNYIQVDDLLGKAIENAIFYGGSPTESLTEAAQRSQELIEAS